MSETQAGAEAVGPDTDLEPGVFTRRSPRSIALSLKRSADRSRRRKSDAFRSAMSMLNFYINRAGGTGCELDGFTPNAKKVVYR